VTKESENYLGLSYPVLLRKISDDGEEYYFAEIPDLPGCMAHGTSPDEAMESLEESKRLWIEERLDQGYPVPEPRDLEEFSGKFVQRLPKVLHRELTIQAKRNGVSLNQYIVSLLSREVGKEELKEELLTEIRAIYEKEFKIPYVLQVLPEADVFSTREQEIQWQWKPSATGYPLYGS